MCIQSCTKIQELLPVLHTSKSVILIMYKKHTKKGRKKMAKRKTGKDAELAGLEVLNNGLLVRKSDMEVVGIHGCTDESDLRHLVIPEGVRSIGEKAFLGHSEIISVSFPESLEKIGALSFCMCKRLQTVSIPKNVKIIKAYAFQGCDHLAEVKLNEGLLVVEDYAFAGTEVAKLDLPASVRALGDNALANVNAVNIRSTDMPHNLIRAISPADPADWHGYYWKYDSFNTPMTVEISITGRVIYLPKFINESDMGLCECALNSGVPGMEENLFQYGKSGKPSYDTAFAMYSYLYAFGRKPSDELTTYIRRVGKKIAEYMIESNRTHDAIRLISFNILTSNALKSLHESAVQQNRTEVAAYLMEAIKKNGKSTSMRL